MPTTSSRALREAMVAALEDIGAIRSDAVRQAFLAVPREDFVPDVVARDGLDSAYRPDVALVTATDHRGVPISSSSAPAIMAPMLEALELGDGMRVLEVGAGTGYNAALLKHLVGDRGRVTSVEVDAGFARRARRALIDAGYRCRVVVGDGRRGWPDGAPFDRVIATASSDHVPQAWRDQLVDGGLVELPLRLTTTFMPQLVACFRREGELLASTALIPGGFMSLRHPDSSAPTKAVPTLRASAGGARRGQLSLEGEGLAALSPRAARRALSLLLGPSRRLRTMPRAAATGLTTFLALSGHRSLLRCNVAGRVGIAVVPPTGSSIAASTVTTGRPGRIDAWGDDHAEAILGRHIQRWERAGRPTLDDLRLVVGYSDPLPGRHWRTLTRRDSTIAMDWATAPRPSRSR